MRQLDHSVSGAAATIILEVENKLDELLMKKD